MFVMSNICHDKNLYVHCWGKSFVLTSILCPDKRRVLSWQKFCRDKTIILVAAPGNDMTRQHRTDETVLTLTINSNAKSHHVTSVCVYRRGTALNSSLTSLANKLQPPPLRQRRRREPSETGKTCPRKSRRPRPSTHLCQGPPDYIFFFFLRCWPSLKWQNNHHIVQELCESRDGRPGLSVLTSLNSGFRGRKAILNHASALVSACP